MGLAKVHSIALFHLTRQADIVFDQAGNLFDAYAYSRFKYGSAYMARQYALQLYRLLRQHHAELWQIPTLWLTSSAYKFVPTASDSLAHYLWEHWLKKTAASPIEKVKISRSLLFPADYGNLSQEERKQIMSKVDLHFDDALHTSQPKDLLIIDDIRITGAHEHRLLEFAERQGFERIYFAYIAHLSPKAEPTTEHWLNHTAIRDLEDLWDLWQLEGCLLNARICKFLLSYPDAKALEKFAKALPATLAAKIAEGMWQDGYADMEMYAENWKIWTQYASICEWITLK